MGIGKIVMLDYNYKDDKFYILRNLLRVQRAFGIGTAKAYEAYKTLKERDIIHCDAYTVYKMLPEKFAKPFYNVKREYNDRIMNMCSANRINIVCIEDEEYPKRLKELYSPPLLLYYKGNLPDIDKLPALCIVGPRKVTEFGAKSAYSLAFRLARAGFPIISGAAVGSDYYAHRGALDAGGFTIGVLGCGLLYDYLPQNAQLRKEISEKGCLISEYPPFCQPGKFTFPVRNRIMAALSVGVAVTEAGESSGALNTAHQAADLNKDVFVVPGNPTLEQYKGSNKLLREGALPLIDTSDIFNCYLAEYADKFNVEKAFSKSELAPKFVYPAPNSRIKRTSPAKTHDPYDFSDKKEDIKLSDIFEKKSVKSLSKEAQIVYNYIDKRKFSADDILGSGLSDDEILSALTELEMEKLIKALPGGFYELSDKEIV